jgi:ribosomal protein S18 acetylase RimI-like enzyme
MGSALTPRAFDVNDELAVLDLVNADRIPGQPACTAGMLAAAVAGSSPVDSGWWAELDRLAIDVLVDDQDAIRGAVSYAHRKRDQAGVVLWLHGREDPAVVEALVSHAIGRLTSTVSLAAFEFASALTVGLEGLPVRHRPVTRRVLLAHSFEEADLWRYMLRGLPAAALPGARESHVLTDLEQPGWRIEVRSPDGARLGDAQVSLAFPDLGVLWWIGIEPVHRGRGLGWSLLGSALDVLYQHGAREVLLFVDDDAPGDDPERGRAAANALYDRAGFTEIDRLCSYSRAR